MRGDDDIQDRSADAERSSRGQSGQVGASAAARKSSEEMAEPSPSSSSPGSSASPAEVAPVHMADTEAYAHKGEEGAPTSVRPRTDSLIGHTLLGRYRITGKLGQGGMGVVYEAEHVLIGKRVAIKVLLDKYARQDPVVARLEQEARLASAIGHEHIVDITDFGETSDGRRFVVMEYLDGESLASCLTREQHLPEERVVEIAFQVASALAAAHDKGVIHRDIKPENIFLLDRQGRDYVKVVDFGISKSLGGDNVESVRLTETGMVLGTPLYMSPEQARGDEDVDYRIDIYALGVIMYEMATGEVPFRGANSLNVISRVLNVEPPLPRDVQPELSEDLEAVIVRAMAKDREERYQSCADFAADLALLLDTSTSGSGRRVSGRRRATSFGVKGRHRSRLGIRKHSTLRSRRRYGRWLLWAAGAMGLAAITVAVVAMLMPQPSAPSAPAPAIGQSPVPPVSDPQHSGVPATASPAPPSVTMAQVTITSEPTGATIYTGGRVWGATPLILDLPKENRRVDFIAELPGHRDSAFYINPLSDDGETIAVRLELDARESTAATQDGVGAESAGAPDSNMNEHVDSGGDRGRGERAESRRGSAKPRSPAQRATRPAGERATDAEPAQMRRRDSERGNDELEGNPYERTPTDSAETPDSTTRSEPQKQPRNGDERP